MSCPLCDLADREPENTLIQDELCALVRTKKLKGHRERLMIVSKIHGDKLEWRHYASKWQDTIEKTFDYTYKVIVLEGKYGSIPNHWHVCLTDIEQGSDDFHQILGTPWLAVLDIKPWRPG